MEICTFSLSSCGLFGVNDSARAAADFSIENQTPASAFEPALNKNSCARSASGSALLSAKPDGERTTENQSRKQITFRLSQFGFPV